jgi:tRNA(Ile)-lysidine synthase
LQTEIIENPGSKALFNSVYNGGVCFLDRDRVSGALEVRNWRPGDQYQPSGHTEQTKIKLLFQSGRIPLWERRHWPIVTSGEAIVWARRFGPAANFAATAESRRVLRIEDTAD